MVKWEYAVVGLGVGQGVSPAKTKSILDGLGAEGWELVAMEFGSHSNYWANAYMKRQVAS